jgi:trigger factor
LKTEKTLRDDHQAEIIVEFEQDELQQYKKRAARIIAKQAKVPGFRPGKAPYEVIERLYGDDAIKQQAVEIMVDEKYSDVLTAAEVEPAAAGKLEEIISTEPPKFKFLVPLTPIVELGNYQAIRKEYSPEPVSDDEVEQVITNMRKSFATAEPANRPAENGDLVYIKISGSLTDPAEGEDPQIIKDSATQVVIGDNDPRSGGGWPFPGFAEQLIGLSEGEEKSLLHTYEEDSPYKNLSGKTVDYQVTIQSVKFLKLPELDEKFIKMMGNYESVEDMRTAIRADLEAHYKEEFDDKYLSEVVDEIVEQSTVKYPPQLVDEEIKTILDKFNADLAEQRMDLDTYLKVRNLEKAQFIDSEIRPAAKRRLERSLVMDQVGKAESIKLDEAELQNSVKQTLEILRQRPDFKKFNNKRNLQNITNSITVDTAWHMLNQSILNRIKDISTGKAESEPAKTETE